MAGPDRAGTGTRGGFGAGFGRRMMREFAGGGKAAGSEFGAPECRGAVLAYGCARNRGGSGGREVARGAGEQGLGDPLLKVGRRTSAGRGGLSS